MSGIPITNGDGEVIGIDYPQYFEPEWCDVGGHYGHCDGSCMDLEYEEYDDVDDEPDRCERDSTDGKVCNAILPSNGECSRDHADDYK